MGNDFDNTIFEPLHLLLFNKENPDYEFVDEEINLSMRDLFQSIETFLSFKAVNTFPTQFNTQALKSWKNESYDYEEGRKLAIAFNNLATNIWDKYKQLNRICKAKLY